jgi:hypothetical protein
MTIASTNIPEHITGDTFNGVTFVIKLNGILLDLTGYTAVLTAGSVNNSKTARYKIALALANPTAGEISLLEQIISWPCDDYRYEITFTSTTNVVKTWIRGAWKISEKLQ